MDDLEEQLTCPWVEDKNGTIDGLCGQVTLKCLKINGKYLQFSDFKDDPFRDLIKKNNVYLMNGDTIHIGIVNKPDNLVGEKFTIVL